MSENRSEKHKVLKILFVGEGEPGKTMLLRRLYNKLRVLDWWEGKPQDEQKFSESYVPIPGIDFKVANPIIETKRYKFQLWDTSGQESQRFSTDAYYRGADTVVYTADATDTRALDRLEGFLSRDIPGRNPGQPIVIVINKSDLEENPEIKKEIKKCAQEHGIECIECSAKTNQGIDELQKLVFDKSRAYKQQQKMQQALNSASIRAKIDSFSKKYANNRDGSALGDALMRVYEKIYTDGMPASKAFQSEKGAINQNLKEFSKTNASRATSLLNAFLAVVSYIIPLSPLYFAATGNQSRWEHERGGAYAFTLFGEKQQAEALTKQFLHAAGIELDFLSKPEEPSSDMHP